MDTEQWIQCHQCQKWRVVSENVKINVNIPWVCKYNVFDPQHNTCHAPQEELPTDGFEEPASPAEGFEEPEPVEVDASHPDEEMFTPSTCPCKICREINISVSTWKQISKHSIPFVNCIVRSISATEQIAHNAEDEKQFIKGVHIDLHHPPLSNGST